jgi:hypothetical protein
LRQCRNVTEATRGSPKSGHPTAILRNSTD